MSETEEEITALLARLDASWSQRDFDDILALWDREETDPIYVAEEADTNIGWPAIEAYFAATGNLITRAAYRRSGTRVKDIGPDLALVFYDMHWNVELAPGGLYGGEMIAGDVRVSMVLRRKPEGWRIFHYMEAPPAAMNQMREAMTAKVDPDFRRG